MDLFGMLCAVAFPDVPGGSRQLRALSQPAQKISEQFISLCNLWRNLGEQLMNPFSP